MPSGEWTTDQVEVTVSGLFTTRHCLQTAVEMLAELTVPTFRTSSPIQTADGRALMACQTSRWKSWYELREGETVLGSARPRSAFRRELVVQYGDQAYTLRPAGFWTRSWLLADGIGTTLLEIRPRGFLRRGAYLAILAELDVALLTFAYYLVYQRWQAEAAAAAVH